nr:hypothetical protein [Tanacetum cinerariifolium]
AALLDHGSRYHPPPSPAISSSPIHLVTLAATSLRRRSMPPPPINHPLSPCTTNYTNRRCLTRIYHHRRHHNDSGGFSSRFRRRGGDVGGGLATTTTVKLMKLQISCLFFHAWWLDRPYYGIFNLVLIDLICCRIGAVRRQTPIVVAVERWYSHHSRTMWCRALAAQPLRCLAKLSHLTPSLWRRPSRLWPQQPPQPHHGGVGLVVVIP